MLGSNAADGVHLSRIPEHLLRRLWQPGRAAWTEIVEMYWVATPVLLIQPSFHYVQTNIRTACGIRVNKEICWRTCHDHPIYHVQKGAVWHANIAYLSNCPITLKYTISASWYLGWWKTIEYIQCLLNFDLFNIFCAVSQIQLVHNSFVGVESNERTTE